MTLSIHPSMKVTSIGIPMFIFRRDGCALKIFKLDPGLCLEFGLQGRLLDRVYTH